jgi:uncharacterized phiE125 gp8 family phage protein
MWRNLVCVTPGAQVLSLDDAKAHLRVTHTDHDALITALIASAQAYIEGPRGVGQALADSTWRLSLDTWPGLNPSMIPWPASGWATSQTPIRIPLTPVTSITSITYVDQAGVTQTLNPSQYLADIDTRPARIAPAYGVNWPLIRDQLGAIKITFKAGPASPPADLVNAMKLLIGHWYDNPNAMVSKDLMNAPHSVEAILSRHRVDFTG